ncbi:MAG: class I SAM-dependent methyltransferase [Anaerolineae bacterium]|nr:class I SAM-dependent methyltransferase [Anaerolineae bacterium]
MTSTVYFNQIADQWDTMRQSFFPDAVREAAITAASAQPGDRAADIGAGSGFITEVLLNAGLTVAAVDPSENMLAILRDKFGATDRLELHLGTAEPIPLPDESVSFTFANMCLHHVETPPNAIREMARILRPGGKLIITDLDPHTFRFLVEEQHDRWMGFDRAEIARWFVNAGLTEVTVTSVGSNCCADSECGTQRAAVNIFIAVGVKALSPTNT